MELEEEKVSVGTQVTSSRQQCVHLAESLLLEKAAVVELQSAEQMILEKQMALIQEAQQAMVGKRGVVEALQTEKGCSVCSLLVLVADMQTSL